VGGGNFGLAGRSDCHPFGAVGLRDLSVSSLSVVRQPGADLSGQDAAKLALCTKVFFRDVESRDLMQGPQFYGCTDVVAVGCISRNCLLSGLGAVDLVDDRETWVGTDRVRFERCRVSGTQAPHYGFRVLGVSHDSLAHGVTLVDCVASDNAGAGIYVKCAQGVLLQRCRAVRNGQDGIALLGSQTCTVERCTALNNNTSQYRFGYMGISVGRSPELVGPCLDNVVRACRSGNSKPHVGQSYGYYEFDGAFHSTVTFNDFRGNVTRPAEYRPGTVHYGNKPRG